MGSGLRVEEALRVWLKSFGGGLVLGDEDFRIWG